MVYQHPMFTHRICCCNATVASCIMACIAMVLCAFVCVMSWYTPGVAIYLNIYQTILVASEIIACVLVFVAVCKLRPRFVLPIIVIQIWNSISLIAMGIWVTIDFWMTFGDIYGTTYFICQYVISLLISLFVLHCHVCCFKLLIFRKHAFHSYADCEQAKF